MRRSDRELKSMDEIIRVMQNSEVCRLALNGSDGYPYILPLNFGMRVEDCMQAEDGAQANEMRIVLYFHGALEGTKYDLIAKDNRASFEMEAFSRLVPDAAEKNCTTEYESVIGKGLVEMIPDSQKYEALQILMKHYHQEDFPFNTAVMPATRVFKLTVTEVTGKARKKKKKS